MRNREHDTQQGTLFVFLVYFSAFYESNLTHVKEK